MRAPFLECRLWRYVRGFVEGCVYSRCNLNIPVWLPSGRSELLILHLRAHGGGIGEALIVRPAWR